MGVEQSAEAVDAAVELVWHKLADAVSSGTALDPR